MHVLGNFGSSSLSTDANSFMSRKRNQSEDVEKWSGELGLLPVPIFTKESDSRFVMLNGRAGNFCLYFTGESGDKRDIAWSSDVGHYVTVSQSSVEVQRWDAAPQVKE